MGASLLERLFGLGTSNRQVKYDRAFLDMCLSLAGLSKCVSHQVACLIVKDNRIVSSGINGTASGMVNCCDRFNPKKYDKRAHDEFTDAFEFHAEENAVLYAAKIGISIDGATAYCTLEPCFPCLKKLHGAGVRRIVYAETKVHRTDKGGQRAYYAKKAKLIFEHFKG